MVSRGTPIAETRNIMRSRGRIAEAASDGLPGGRPVVFVVDDDIATVSLLCEVAREAGWDARGFSRLSDLRRAIESEAPSLLILDDELPDGRGGDLARELRADPLLAGVPLVVCTAAHPMRRAEIGDWAPVVAKPFDLGVMERFMESVHPARAGRSRNDRAG